MAAASDPAALDVLIVVTSTDRRGAEVEGQQLAGALSALGHQAECVALAPGRSGGLAVTALGAGPRSLGTLRALRRRASGAQVVLAYGSATLPACATSLAGAGVPFVYRSIGDPARWAHGGWRRRRTGLMLRRAARVVALWPAAARSITDLYGVPSPRLACIPNARPLPSPDEPDRESARLLLGVPADAVVVAWAGALSEEKQPLRAVEAVAAMPGAWLVMAGDGPLRTDVEAACAEMLPGRHALPGVLAALAPLWAAADVALLTSRTEGMPGVLVEAALRGVPCVATDVGAVREVVGDGGAVVPAEAGADEIVAALGRCLGRRADHRHAEQFTWPVVAEQWVDLLGSVVR